MLRTVRRYLQGGAPPTGPRCGVAEVVGCFEEAARQVRRKTGAGLLLIVDEAGKALEYAAQQPARGDVYLLQALAEAAARSDGAPFVVLTVLHQAFDQYAHQLDAAEQTEWAKVQGRFGELAFRDGGDQVIRLTAAAIQPTGGRRRPRGWDRLVRDAAAWIAGGTGWNDADLARQLDACWPLHPVTAALLGPLFRGRLAQNERSLFAFLAAGEPLGFHDFLRTGGPDALFPVDRLYDYAVGALGSRLVGRDGRPWAEIDAALRRLPPEADAVDERVLKTVGLLAMLGDRTGLRASAAAVAACVGGTVRADRARADQALARLQARSLIVHRQFRDAFAIWAGSDLDLDALMRRADGELPADFSVAGALRRRAPRRPLVARRHLFETGAARFFDVRFVDAAALLGQADPDLTGDGDGVLLLAIPASAAEAAALRTWGDATLAPAQGADDAVGQASLIRWGGGRPVVLIAPGTAARIAPVARALAAAERVAASTPALASDPAARTELAGRIDDLTRQLDDALDQACDPARSTWYATGGRLPAASWRDAAQTLSDLCDLHYDCAIPIRNELLNRRALSTSAARARRSLVEAMMLRADRPRLGFTGYPPEISMYRSLLEEHGLHRRRRSGWGFGPPRMPKAAGAWPVWEEIERWLADTEAGRRPLDELYARLRQPPVGLKDGPLPVVVLAALLAHDADVAVYEHGSFLPAWTPSHGERLLRTPKGFEVRQCRIDGPRRDVLRRLGAALAGASAAAAAVSGRTAGGAVAAAKTGGKAAGGAAPRAKTGARAAVTAKAAGEAAATAAATPVPTLLDLVRRLVRTVTALPPYGRRTVRGVSATARAIRDVLMRAREPAALLFDDLPAACGCPSVRAAGNDAGPDDAGQDGAARFVAALTAGLRDLQQAYPALLARCEAAVTRQLGLPAARTAWADELQRRAGDVAALAVEPALRSFVVRAADAGLEPDDRLVSLLTQLADKPPVDWADADEDRFQVRLAQAARAFRETEALLVDATAIAAADGPGVAVGSAGGTAGRPRAAGNGTGAAAGRAGPTGRRTASTAAARAAAGTGHTGERAAGRGAGAATLLRLAVARRGAAPHERVLVLRDTPADRALIEALRDRILHVTRPPAENAQSATNDEARAAALAALALAAETLMAAEETRR